jgi:hypothetical protein
MFRGAAWRIGAGKAYRKRVAKRVSLSQCRPSSRPRLFATAAGTSSDAELSPGSGSECVMGMTTT